MAGAVANASAKALAVDNGLFDEVKGVCDEHTADPACQKQPLDRHERRAKIGGCERRSEPTHLGHEARRAIIERVANKDDHPRPPSRRAGVSHLDQALVLRAAMVALAHQTSSSSAAVADGIKLASIVSIGCLPK